MLVLTRKKEEAIVIVTSDGDITVTVSELHASKIKLAIEAPKNVPVHRREVLQRKNQKPPTE